MIHKKKHEKDVQTSLLRENDPVFGASGLRKAAPKYNIPSQEMTPRNAYQVVHDELMLDGNSRLNLATFVTTWIEPEAAQLMNETF